MQCSNACLCTSDRLSSQQSEPQQLCIITYLRSAQFKACSDVDLSGTLSIPRGSSLVFSTLMLLISLGNLAASCKLNSSSPFQNSTQHFSFSYSSLEKYTFSCTTMQLDSFGLETFRSLFKSYTKKQTLKHNSSRTIHSKLKV